jgi:hypothetical protein
MNSGFNTSSYHILSIYIHGLRKFGNPQLKHKVALILSSDDKPKHMWTYGHRNSENLLSGYLSNFFGSCGTFNNSLYAVLRTATFYSVILQIQQFGFWINNNSPVILKSLSRATNNTTNKQTCWKNISNNLGKGLFLFIYASFRRDTSLREIVLLYTAVTAEVVTLSVHRWH